MGQEQSAPDGTEHELLNFGKNTEAEVTALLYANSKKEFEKKKNDYNYKRNMSK